MGFLRSRKPSWKTAVGITKAKRRIAKATGIPTSRSGRKRKARNLLTGGAYGRYERKRAAVNRPFKRARRASSGCLVAILEVVAIIVLIVILLL